jgi:lysophospholipid acyltransferase (LPLAT)-like uncharacterized protein
MAQNGSRMKRLGRFRRPLLGALARVVPPLLYAVLRTLQATLRIRYIGAQAPHARLARGQQVILAYWHRFNLMLPVMAPGAPLCTMVSQHRDGEMAIRVLAHWGVSGVRGSATRGGVGGFMRLVDAYGRGESVALATDGPRGPADVVKPGVVRLAKLTGAPIYPVAFATSRAYRLRSWDRMVIPLPFARALVEFGEPLAVASDAGADQLEACRAELERRLAAVTTSVERRLRRDDDRRPELTSDVGRRTSDVAEPSPRPSPAADAGEGDNERAGTSDGGGAGKQSVRRPTSDVRRQLQSTANMRRPT